MQCQVASNLIDPVGERVGESVLRRLRRGHSVGCAARDRQSGVTTPCVICRQLRSRCCKSPVGATATQIPLGACKSQPLQARNVASSAGRGCTSLPRPATRDRVLDGCRWHSPGLIASAHRLQQRSAPARRSESPPLIPSRRSSGICRTRDRRHDSPPSGQVSGSPRPRRPHNAPRAARSTSMLAERPHSNQQVQVNAYGQQQRSVMCPQLARQGHSASAGERHPSGSPTICERMCDSLKR